MQRRNLILSVASGALLALAFPPLRFGFIAYGALIPFLMVFPQSDHKDALLYGFVAGLVFNAGTVYWICWATIAGGLFSVFYLSLFFMLFALLLNLVTRAWGIKGLLLAPFLWTGIEYLRSFGQLAFPWTFLGNTQTEYTPLIQFASITGVYGVSFWILTINTCFYNLFRQISLKRIRVGGRLFSILVVLILLFVLPYIYGRRVIPRERLKGEIEVAIIQPSIPVDIKWGPEGLPISFAALEQLTLRVCPHRPDLIIWPETATPCYLMRQGRYRRRLYSFCDSVKTPIFTGSPDYDFQTRRFYNSAFLFMPGEREVQSYDKMHLVPGSERVPFSDRFQFLKKIALRAGDFSMGKRFTVFQHPKGRFSVLICFESIFPELTRQFVLRGAEFLVNITNDAWFGRTSGPYQHAQIAVFRAIENRIAIARCANTGVSMLIDPYGRVSGATPIFTPKILVDTLPLRKGETFFTRYGNLFAKLCVAVLVMAVLWVVGRGVRRVKVKITIPVLLCAIFTFGFIANIAFAKADKRHNNHKVQIESALGDPVLVCGTPHFREEAIFFAKNYVRRPLSIKELRSREKIDALGNRVMDYVGQQVSFWTVDLYNDTYEQITATCQAVGAKCYIYVDDNESINSDIIDDIVNEFDSNVYPTDRANFGSEWKPGIDGDNRITILIYNIKDGHYYAADVGYYIGGYFYANDEYRRDDGIHLHSNEREMFYMDLNPATPGSNGFYGTLAHEFQHMIHWNQDADEETWVDEGCAQIAEFICGYGIDYPNNFANNPDNDLTFWGGELIDYEQCLMWTLYLYEQYGGSSTIKALVSESANGIVGINNTLSDRGCSERFSDIFHDWIIANYLDDLSVDSGKYGYTNLDLSSYPMNISDSFNSYPVSSSGSVDSYAADYTEFTDGSSATFDYSGPGMAQLIEIGSSSTVVEDLANGTLTVPGFGSNYDTIILVANGSSSGGPYDYSAILGSGEYMQVAIPDTTVTSRRTIHIPIYVSDVTGKGIYSVGMKLTYDSNVLTATGVRTTGTIASNWGSPTANSGTGQITIGMAGTTALSGSGTLVYVYMYVNGSPGDTTTIHFAEMIFNEGSREATTDDGVLRVCDSFAISGDIEYYSGTCAVKQATVHLTGGATKDAITDNSGNYRFTNLSSADYSVTPSKTGDVGNSIGHFDASYVLRNWAGLLDLNPYQKIAADVTGNGEASHFDASYILRYYVGLIDHFPVGADWKFVPTSFSIDDTNWSSTPDSISYTLLNSDKPNQDFKGIVYGDVTGNWSASISAAKPLVDYELFSKVSLEDISGAAGKEVTLPIVITDISNLYSAGMVLEYDPELLRVTQVKTTDLTEGCIIATNDLRGQLTIALAGAQAVKGRGSLVDVVFEVSQDAKTGQSSSIRLTRFHLNDLRSTALLKEVSFTVGSEIPAVYSLSQSYPNPFNLQTQIRYSLAKAGHVTLSIYSVLGQKVRTLIDETQEAGSYQVIWDGRDERGEIVSSGVYFLNMTAGEFKRTQKILLIK